MRARARVRRWEINKLPGVRVEVLRRNKSGQAVAIRWRGVKGAAAAAAARGVRDEGELTRVKGKIDVAPRAEGFPRSSIEE